MKNHKNHESFLPQTFCCIQYFDLTVSIVRFAHNVLLAGAATHLLDYRKSAGGFIHGFRYTGKFTSVFVCM